MKIYLPTYKFKLRYKKVLEDFALEINLSVGFMPCWGWQHKYEAIYERLSITQEPGEDWCEEL